MTRAVPETRGWAAKMTTPFATLGLVTDGGRLIQVRYLPRDDPAQAPSDAVAEVAIREIERYLADPQHPIDIPLAPKGTPFQRRAWAAIAAIPPGESRTYGELARRLVSAARAVGQACGANPLALVVPCHRVVGSRGELGGFMHAAAGDPVVIKRWLLQHEGYRFGQ